MPREWVLSRRRFANNAMVSTLAAVAALSIVGASSAAPLLCGVCSADLPENVGSLAKIAATGKLDFWWNWDTSPKLDLTSVSADSAAAIESAFNPMMWGQGELADYSFLSNSTVIHGYNEPDLYGPACVGDYDPPNYGCSKGDYRAATSAGWAPLFDPQSAAVLWQARRINNNRRVTLPAPRTTINRV